MPVSESFSQFLLEQLKGAGEAAIRKMFGGAGLYLDGRMVGIIDGSTLYLKADGSNRGLFEKEGMGPFKPFADKEMTMPYYEVPAEVLEDPGRLSEWSRMSWGAAMKKPPKKKG